MSKLITKTPLFYTEKYFKVITVFFFLCFFLVEQAFSIGLPPSKWPKNWIEQLESFAKYPPGELKQLSGQIETTLTGLEETQKLIQNVCYSEFYNSFGFAYVSPDRLGRGCVLPDEKTKNLVTIDAYPFDSDELLKKAIAKITRAEETEGYRWVAGEHFLELYRSLNNYDELIFKIVASDEYQKIYWKNLSALQAEQYPNGKLMGGLILAGSLLTMIALIGYFEPRNMAHGK